MIPKSGHRFSDKIMPKEKGMRLTARDLSIGYRNHLVGSGIDLTLAAGEVLVLLGPNGAGKTTLFRTLLGLHGALGGAVLLDGRPIAGMRPAEIARQMAYVPQAHATEFSFTALDVVLMGRTARLSAFASPGAADERVAREKLVALGIADLADHDYTRISGGQRQLTLIARALAQEAPILVMDEPTASLDFGNQAMVLGRIRDLAAEGYGIVLSTHDPDHALLVGTRVAVIAEGGLRAVGTPQEVVTAEMLSAIYRTQVIVEDTPSGRRVCVPAWGKGANSE
jgi:iron complex transport system ATP-binding protein